MALHIQDPEVERLAEEVAALARETRDEAVRKALEERKVRLETKGESKAVRLEHFLRTEVWPTIPSGVRGKRISKEEEEEILGFGPNGV
ncbi:MAG: type II toxin-antitoxin system VapB family antitoxin [Bryobacterales bacterium]|nr:type II toxin-antitoxin system VapB family antitoxin [Bryobacterales bacterium]